MPFNIPMRYKGNRVEFPLLAVVGFLGIMSILVFTMITHEIGRIAGPSWLVIGVISYLIYRKRKGLPVFGSRPQDWHKAQISILQDAGELELMDEYIANVKALKAETGAAS
jgi:hypothetical protein